MRPVMVMWAGGGTSSATFEAGLEAALAAMGVCAGVDDAELSEGGPARSLAVDNSDLSGGICSGGWFDLLRGDMRDAALRDMLAVMADVADASRDEWLRIVAACARSGAPNARAICRAWSAQSEKFEPAGFERDYRSLAT